VSAVWVTLRVAVYVPLAVAENEPKAESELYLMVVSEPTARAPIASWICAVITV
jgi:hypothetical protein